WDNGLRAVPVRALKHAREALADWAHQNELLSLDQLARELASMSAHCEPLAVRVISVSSFCHDRRLDVPFGAPPGPRDTRSCGRASAISKDVVRHVHRWRSFRTITTHD